MYKSQTFNFIINVVVSVICVTTFLTLLINRNSLYDGYQNMYLLPLLYILSHFLFINRVLLKNGISIFLAVYLVVSLTRFTILPYLILKSGWYFGRSLYSPTSVQFNKAIFLMIYELICYNITIFFAHKYFLSRDNPAKMGKKIIKFESNTVVYFLFIGITLLLLLIRPGALKYISFISVNPNYVSLSEVDTMMSIIILMLSLSRYLLYFIFVKYIINTFNNKYPFSTFVLVCTATLLNSLIFFGTNRSDFLFTFIISLIILNYLYGKIGIFINLFFVTLIPLVITQISSFRESSTITKGKDKLIDITDYLQIYLGGIYNVAISLDLPSRAGNLLLLTADIFRSAIGPNVILKQMDFITSSQLFNYRIYLNDHVAQIIPMIGQGQLYLGLIFAPLLGCVFIVIAVYFTKVIVETNSFELIFMLMLTSGRFGFVMAQNGNIFINELTFILPLFLLIYYMNKKVGIEGAKN